MNHNRRIRNRIKTSQSHVAESKTYKSRFWKSRYKTTRPTIFRFNPQHYFSPLFVFFPLFLYIFFPKTLRNPRKERSRRRNMSTPASQEEDKKPADQAAHINLKVKGQVRFLVPEIKVNGFVEFCIVFFCFRLFFTFILIVLFASLDWRNLFLDRRNRILVFLP